MSVKRSGVDYADFSGGPLNFVIRGKRGDCECSPGCQNCYALTFLERFNNVPEQTTMYPKKLRSLRYARFEEKGRPFRRGPGSRPLLFPCDFGDLFHPLVSDDFILEAFRVMFLRTDCDWLVLTKRTMRMAQFVHDHLGVRLPRHILPGASICTQAEAHVQIAALCAVPAERRWISMEPLLEMVDPFRWLFACAECGARLGHGAIGNWRFNGERWEHYHGYPIGYFGTKPAPQFAFVALGGESGAKRRRFDVAWARPPRDQCSAAGVRFFYKQGSARYPGQDHLLDGQIWHDLPLP